MAAVPYHPKASIHNGNGAVVVDVVLVMAFGLVLAVLEEQRLAMLLRVLVFICLIQLCVLLLQMWLHLCVVVAGSMPRTVAKPDARTVLECHSKLASPNGLTDNKIPKLKLTMNERTRCCTTAWLVASLLAIAVAQTPVGFDPLWLRYSLVPSAQELSDYRGLLGHSAAVICTDPSSCGDAISHSQLEAAASELHNALSSLLGTAFTVTVGTTPPPQGIKLVASVLDGATSMALGREGFRLRQDMVSKTVHIEAGSSSGLLYGTFKMISLIQQLKAIPQVSCCALPHCAVPHCDFSLCCASL